MKYVFGLKDIPADRLHLAGGKAASLSNMLRNTRLRIPQGYVILADAFDGGKLKEEAAEEIALTAASLDGRYTYAVRSSAVNEDGDRASFAGQYETLTDVPSGKVPDAVREVFGSCGSDRVKGYEGSFSQEDQGMGVVIQRFVRAEFAGVVFTSDIISGRNDKLVGNYVRGEGEKLVSGEENAKEFRIGRIRHSYEGDPEFAPYARELSRYCENIYRLYKMPMDIEWAVAKGRVYILQARPVTTLRRSDPDTYGINGSMSGYKLLTRTNVGEIFMKPVSPVTNSVLEKINGFLGLPDWLDNICGQPYMNISVMCSLLVSFGRTESEAFEAIRDLVGNIPEGVTVPVSPFDKKAFLKNLKTLLFPKEKSKLTKKQKLQMVGDLPEISRDMTEHIRGIKSNEELLRYWDEHMLPDLKDAFSSIAAVCGTSMVPLFGTRRKIARIAGADMANRLCGGSIGTVESMKPMLLIDDVIAGRMSKDEYIRTCGHRCVNEMELMEPRPYERESFPDDVIEERISSGADLYAMLDGQKKLFDEALSEFKQKYPSKSRWIDREIAKFAHANDFREDIRSKGVLIFCVFREFLLCFGRINGLGDGVFMLTMDELFECLRGDTGAFARIPARKKTYERYLAYPVFPTVVMGRFDPEKWMADEDRRRDFFCEEIEMTGVSSDVKGFPGAAGKVTGTVRVVTSSDEIDLIEEGDILVTVATNIGWTLVFPKVSAIVTDIGAPLSHAAIVAREFGIPAVVGCGNATTVLKTGDLVIVDGTNGTVSRHSPISSS